MVDLLVRQGDATSHPCDMLILKYANAFHGVDALVAEKIAFNGSVKTGEYSIFRGRNLEAKKVMFIGVGDLSSFRYSQIRTFAYDALNMLKKELSSVKIVATTIHGPGYGLDESESFLSLISGFVEAIEDGSYPAQLEEIHIVEKSPSRAAHLSSLLSQKTDTSGGRKTREVQPSAKNAHFTLSIKENGAVNNKLSSYGAASEDKIKLFVAMPFRSDYSDEWEIAITESAEASGIICERIDQQSYVGDIFHNIKQRIENYNGMLALLNESNPNVFLELGYAWAKGKPAILMLKDGNDLPFDVRGQRCIIYKNIGDLRKKLTNELINLKSSGIFSTTKGVL